MEQAQQYAKSYQAGNQDYMTPTFVELRLSNEKLLSKIENFLSAKRNILLQDEKTKEFYEKEIVLGRPLANAQGVNQILHIISFRTDPLIVQGNFDQQHYFDYIERARKEITEEIVRNCYDWDIQDGKLNTIIDTIMAFIEPFMSRLIDDKERESLIPQFKSNENINTNPQQQQGGILGSFSRGFKKNNGY